MAEPTRSEGVPHDRLTRIGDAMGRTFEAHPEYQDSDRCAIFLDAHDRGGLTLVGYEDDVDAIGAIFTHLEALFRANGMRLEVFPIGSRGEG